MQKITHRFVETNGIRMHIAECGTGPLVVMCHGFPESWYSWRHQLPALAEAGFHAVAPDLRGYGQTDRPEPIDQHSLFHLAGDMVGLLDALDAENAAIAGHDWGGPVAWHCALSRPDRFRGVIGLSVPYRPRQQPSPIFRRFYQYRAGAGCAAVEERVTGIDQIVRDLQPQVTTVLTRLDRQTDALRSLEQRQAQRVSALNHVLDNLSRLREEEPAQENSLPLI